MKQTIMELVIKLPQFQTFLKVLKQTDILQKLNGTELYTIFIPNEEAFWEISEQELDILLEPMHYKELVYILSHHIVKGYISPEELEYKKLKFVKSLAGDFINVEFNNSLVFVDESRVYLPEITAANGIIYSLDRLMLPEYS